MAAAFFAGAAFFAAPGAAFLAGAALVVPLGAACLAAGALAAAFFVVDVAVFLVVVAAATPCTGHVDVDRDAEGAQVLEQPLEVARLDLGGFARQAHVLGTETPRAPFRPVLRRPGG